ncbi:MAG: universal stress protein [Rhodobacter sp.]|nr:universal stress protein [Rhodobacter sp.]
MFQRILAPVDLAHLEKLERALKVTAEEARHHGAPVTFVSVTAAAPGPLAHNPDEFKAKLEAFAREQAESRGIDASALAVISHDPTTDVDDALLGAIDDTGADLVIMASHKPGVAAYFWPSNGGKIASHSDVSVFLVRDT